MLRPKVQNSALFTSLQEHIKLHDKLQDKGIPIYRSTHVQDFAGASYTLTVSRDATGESRTSIKLQSVWPSNLQVDAAVIARLLQQKSPGSLSIVGSVNTISVSWLLSSGLYLVEPFLQRTVDIIAWISKIRCGTCFISLGSD